MSSIRRIEGAAEWESLRRICCDTGNAGEPIEAARRKFFAEHWIGPYQKLRPEWAYVSATPEGRVQGYLTGCPDTATFRSEKTLSFDLPLLLALFLRRYEWNGDARRFARRALRLETGPEERFDPALLRDVFRAYPAHLHVNVDATARSGGIGARLLERYFEDLCRHGIRGVHLFCGKKPLRFYARNGFATLGSIEFRPGVPVFLLGRKL
ncbi:MAG: GNAT family N-acetyltransferase [Oligoflexia bacterium]|nr:GNAT family N-acetyltransferase [Oligoflexia bacterium]